MEYHNNILCISGPELIKSDRNPGGIMSLACYKKQAYTNRRLRIVRNGGGEGCFVLIEFSSLPEKYKKVAIQKYGDINNIAHKKGIMEYLKSDAEAVKYFGTYTIEYNDNIKGLTPEKQTEYVNNAIVLNALVKGWEAHVSARKKTGKRPLTSEFWKNSIQVLPTITGEYSHSLKYKNWRRLQAKVKEYSESGYQCLISGKFANENTVKITPAAGEWLVARYMSKIEIVTTEQLQAEYNSIAEAKGWKKLKSVQAVYEYLHRPEVERIWYAARYGELLAKERYARQNRTKLPTRRDSLWYSDGTKLNYYYRDNNGTIRTCTVYEVMDVYSEFFLGYHISKTEDYEAQYHAFKMAVKTSGVKPYELKYDNQGGHKKLENSDLLKNLSRHAVSTAPYNGKSKTIESAFGRFQSQYLHKDWYFTGQNITAKKKESRQNMESILANIKRLPTLDEIKARYKQRREEWNNAAHFKTGISRAEMYRTSINDGVQKVDDLEIITIFGVTTKNPSTYKASGIEIQVKKKNFAYEVLTAEGEPDRDFNRRNIGRRLYVRYCPDDMSLVSLYEKDATGMRFITMAEPYLEVNRALQDQTTEDHSRIRKNDIKNKIERVEEEKQRNSLLEKHGLHPNQHGLNVPKLKGISKKTDIGELQKEVSYMDEIAAQKEARAKALSKAEKEAEKIKEQEQRDFEKQRLEYLKQRLVTN